MPRPKKKKKQPTATERYRAKMRRAGMRLVQIWVPDPRAPGFAEECARQVAVAAQHVELEREIMEWADAMRGADEWPPS
jgi:hypothetical protein